MIDHRASFGLVCAAILIAGCAGNGDKSNTDSTSTATSATSASPASSTPDSANTPVDPAHYTDANILAKEITGDSGEVAIATMARNKASSAGVKRYAELLVSDHSKGQKEATELARNVSISPQTARGDTTTQAIAHAMTRLQGLAKGPAFDTAFVNHEVEDHQQDIKDAQAMSGAANNAQVKALVEKSLPELRKHLDQAQKLSGKKG